MIIHCPWSKGALKNCHLLLSLSAMNTLFHEGWCFSQVLPGALQDLGTSLETCWPHVCPEMAGSAKPIFSVGRRVRPFREGHPSLVSFPVFDLFCFLAVKIVTIHTECCKVDSGHDDGSCGHRRGLSVVKRPIQLHEVIPLIPGSSTDMGHRV